MRIIYKYEIPIKDEFILDLPLDSEVLCVQVQKGLPYIWVSFDDTVLYGKRNFCLRGTGIFFAKSDTERYIGTFQFDGFVGHLFELPE